jgi:acyl carrier protein
MDRTQALELVYGVIDVLNRQLPPSRRLSKSPETVIVGPSGALDSLGIVNFVVALEEHASDALGISVQLLDESAIVDVDGPFRSVGTLVTFLQTLPRQPAR